MCGSAEMIAVIKTDLLQMLSNEKLKGTSLKGLKTC
jgi:hypothetical protein